MEGVCEKSGKGKMIKKFICHINLRKFLLLKISIPYNAFYLNLS